MGEWESFDGTTGESLSAARCLTVAETANARRVLEGYENFSYFYGADRPDDDSTTLDEGLLTIRQMALLAGMEEMSIRAAANRTTKRATPLITSTDEKRRTRIRVEDAKAWLMVRGRYLPVKRGWKTGDVDLTKRSFKHFHDLYEVIHARLLFIESSKGRDVSVAIVHVALRCDYEVLKEKLLRDPNFVRELAVALDFPVDLFSLRAREALAKDELAAIDRALQSL